METAERIMRGRVYIQHEPWIKFASDVIDAARLSFTVLGPRDAKKFDQFHRAILFLAVRAFRAAEASFRLFEQGWGHEAFIPLRTLFEHFVDLRYLANNHEAAKDFWEYAPVGYWRYIKAAEKYLPVSPFEEDFKAKVLKDYEAVKDRFLDENRWARQNFRARVEKLKDPLILEQYDFIYRACSEYVHTGPMTYSKYFVESGNVIDIQLGGDVPDRPDALVYMAGVLLQVLEVYDTVFDLKQKDLLLALVRRTQALTGTES